MGDSASPQSLTLMDQPEYTPSVSVTTREAVHNLLKEGISKENIFFVGNTMIDSLIGMPRHFDNAEIQQKEMFNNPYALITIHRPHTVDKKRNLELLVGSLMKLAG